MKSESAKSYLSVAYDLRPSKQVERRMLLDFFRRLASCGIPVEKFRYTGMGSIHFIDHILFHKFLGIDKLVSVEKEEEIEERIYFNRPFDLVEIHMMEIGEFIPCLNTNEQHIVWADYDYRISRGILDDIRGAAYVLPSGSFVLVTVDAEPPKDSGGPADNFAYFKNLSGDLWNPNWSSRDFEKEHLQFRSISLLASAFKEGVAGRPGIEIVPCFSFAYADGHQMATLGVQLGGETEKANLRKLKDQGAEYLVLDFEEPPFLIDVPILTRRERLLLESTMPSSDYQMASESGIGEEDFNKFANVYRFLPSYAELLLG